MMTLLSLFWVPTAAMAAGEVTVTAPENGSGLNLILKWPKQTDFKGSFAIVRGTSADGPWVLAKGKLGGDKTTYKDKVTEKPLDAPPEEQYFYRVLKIPSTFVAPEIADDAKPEEKSALMLAAYLKAYDGELTGQGKTEASLFNDSPGVIFLLAIILVTGILIFVFTQRVRRGEDIPIRRIAGIDAIEEGIGRATEMGKPVLYIPGINPLQDIQTIASMLILGEVSKTIAEYQTDVIVSCMVPIVREVADEVVKTGYFRAGHPDAYDPTSVRFISSDQFAFCAGTNGIMYRQKPATNIYLGTFYAESLILAETGFVNDAIQIAGTAEVSQLPFFIAACDFTLIGEELFAVSAYLSKDARLVSSLKASDYIKVAIVILVVLGTFGMTLDLADVQSLFQIGGG